MEGAVGARMERQLEVRQQGRVASGDRGGRPAVTSAHELAAVAQRLFIAHGFDETSVDDIATAAGISRRTFFRYFSTKADVCFADSPAELAAEDRFGIVGLGWQLSNMQQRPPK